MPDDYTYKNSGTNSQACHSRSPAWIRDGSRTNAPHRVTTTAREITAAVLPTPIPTTTLTSNTTYTSHLVQGQETDKKAAGTALTTTPTRTAAHTTMMALEAPPTLLLAETRPRPHSLKAAAKNRESTIC